MSKRPLRAGVELLDGGRFVVWSRPIGSAGSPAAVRGPDLSVLTLAEQEVARRLLGGAALRSIATARGVTAGTVSKQVGRIYRKLGVHSRSELAALVGRGARVSRLPAG